MQTGDDRRHSPRKDPENGGGRTPPKGMPRDVASRSAGFRQASPQRDHLPEQKPVTDDIQEPKRPSKLKTFFKRLGIMLLVGIALCMAFVFLLLGEPEQATDEQAATQEEIIRVPMAAVEANGSADLSAMAATFGKPMLVLYGNPIPLQKVTLLDTAFQGGYARRATLLYAFPDGQALRVESIRPTAAASMLSHSGSSLYIENIYSLAGLDAARMDSEGTVSIFAKSGEAVYAISFPSSHLAELNALVRQTTLLEP